MNKQKGVADVRHNNGVKLPVLLKILNKQEFVSMFEKKDGVDYATNTNYGISVFCNVKPIEIHNMQFSPNIF